MFLETLAEIGAQTQNDSSKLVPSAVRGGAAAFLDRCRSARFLDGGESSGAQPGAFYMLALGSGMRKAELCGLRWTDPDLDAGTCRSGSGTARWR